VDNSTSTATLFEGSRKSKTTKSTSTALVERNHGKSTALVPVGDPQTLQTTNTVILNDYEVTDAVSPIVEVAAIKQRCYQKNNFNPIAAIGPYADREESAYPLSLYSTTSSPNTSDMCSNSDSDPRLSRAVVSVDTSRAVVRVDTSGAVSLDVTNPTTSTTASTSTALTLISISTFNSKRVVTNRKSVRASSAASSSYSQAGESQTNPGNYFARFVDAFKLARSGIYGRFGKAIVLHYVSKFCQAYQWHPAFRSSYSNFLALPLPEKTSTVSVATTKRVASNTTLVQPSALGQELEFDSLLTKMMQAIALVTQSSTQSPASKYEYGRYNVTLRKSFEPRQRKSSSRVFTSRSSLKINPPRYVSVFENLNTTAETPQDSFNKDINLGLDRLFKAMRTTHHIFSSRIRMLEASARLSQALVVV